VLPLLLVVLADVCASPRPPDLPAAKITLDLKDADVRSVMRLLAQAGDVNIVVGDEVQGTVTLKVSSPWGDVLCEIARARRLTVEQSGRTYLLQKKEK
jgi:type IV pilus assembly protein PilQ